VVSWIRDRALTLVLMAMFLLFLVGQILTGRHEYNATQKDHGQAAVAITGYLATGHFWEALFENWESEFLQMAVFVLLTTSSIRKDRRSPGVPASRNGRCRSPRLRRPARRTVAGQARRMDLAALRAFAGPGLRAALPGVVRRARLGGLRRVRGGPVAHRQPRPVLTEYLTSSRFWFESFQNWQSEFLAIASMVWLAVYLRQRWSPESKPVHAPHHETGH
jgi:hypothetical protein